jgi:hypothetical protein
VAFFNIVERLWSIHIFFKKNKPRKEGGEQTHRRAWMNLRDACWLRAIGVQAFFSFDFFVRVVSVALPGELIDSCYSDP